jgi:hypothetical protein
MGNPAIFFGFLSKASKKLGVYSQIDSLFKA